MKDITLIAVTLIVIIILFIIILSFIKKTRKKGYKKKLDSLDIEKNKIASTPIIPELAKVENYLKNEKIETMYKEWSKRLEDIRENQVPKITDMLLEADYTLAQRDNKTTLYKIAKLEMEIYKARTNAEFLLDEIKEITTSEERSRKVITKYKQIYRELFEKFKESESDFDDIAEIVELQFKSIAKKFEEYEIILDNNKYELVNETIEAIEGMLKHMEIVLEEMPQIILMAYKVLPMRIKETKDEYINLIESGYVLDYLNVEENIKESNKKIKEIKTRSKKLNMKDSVLELKVLLEYFDSIFEDFEKEKINRKQFEDIGSSFDKRLKKINSLVTDIFNKLGNIKELYNLEEDDILFLQKIRMELKKLNEDYKVLLDNTSSNSFAYSKITKEIEILAARLKAIEESLESTIDTIGSMKQDESRAKEQYNEITKVLKSSRNFLREYPIPVIPKKYYIELQESKLAIQEIIIELDKKPINIDTLNIRVETASDLVYKLFNKSKDMIKSAAFAEMAIVYGNRYRSSYEDLDKKLDYAEALFFKGEYTEALEVSISALNKIEPGIYNKLQEYYSK